MALPTRMDSRPARFNVVITSISLNITGPWQTILDLPAVGVSDGAEESTDICLTHATWKAAVANPMPLPDDLDGLLMTANPLAPDYYYHIMTVNLDGSNEQIIAESDGGELSPDSSKMIYNSDTGLQMMDMETKAITMVSGTAMNDRGPLWSPDGTKIAFTRGPASGLIGAPGPYSIIVSNPDGSNQVALVSNTDANFAQAWLPDGETLLYTVASPEGASVRKIKH